MFMTNPQGAFGMLMAGPGSLNPIKNIVARIFFLVTYPKGEFLRENGGSLPPPGAGVAGLPAVFPFRRDGAAPVRARGARPLDAFRFSIRRPRRSPPFRAEVEGERKSLSSGSFSCS